MAISNSRVRSGHRWRRWVSVRMKPSRKPTDSLRASSGTVSHYTGATRGIDAAAAAVGEDQMQREAQR